MRTTTFSPRSILFGTCLLLVTVALVSWDLKKSPGRFQPGFTDTVPKNKTTTREKKIVDLDDVLDELDGAALNIDFEKMQRDINEAMKNFDGDKWKIDVEKAMKEVDFDKIRKNVDESMAKIDWGKMNNDMEGSFVSIDWSKMKKLIDESISKIDWDHMKKGFDEAKNIQWDKMDFDMKNMKEQLKNIGPELEKAKGEIEKAKADIKEYKEFLNGLQSDGLINTKEDYSVKHRDGELIVNGQKVSTEIYNKYRPFLDNHKSFRIKKEADDFDFDVDKD